MDGTIFATISTYITTYMPIIVSVVGSFALIATLTPNKADDKIVSFLLQLVNFLGGNIGKAKNEE